MANCSKNVGLVRQVVHAETAGAVAVAIVSNEEVWMPMGEDGVHWPSIPSAHLPRSQGNAMRQAMRAAAEAGEAAWGELRLLQAPDQAASSGACPAHGGGGAEPGQAQLLQDASQQCRVQEADGSVDGECGATLGGWERESCSAEGEGSFGVSAQNLADGGELEDEVRAGEQQGTEAAALEQQEGAQLEGLATEGLAAQVMSTVVASLIHALPAPCHCVTTASAKITLRMHAHANHTHQ